MDYTLIKEDNDGVQKKKPIGKAFSKMLPLLASEKVSICIALCFLFLDAAFSLLGPLIVGYTIDTYVQTENYQGLFLFSGLLLLIYVAAFTASYTQMRVMGAVAQRMLWRLRNDVFNKLQELPLDFFNQNKSGDLISRINNDTDKLNQFFSEGLIRFAGSFFIVIGAGAFVLSLNWRLGLAALAPALVIFIFMKIIASWLRKKNLRELGATGALSAEVQETMSNFRVILAFNRRDYFRNRFKKVNEKNFKASLDAELANGLLTPVFEFAGNIALLIVLSYGIVLISQSLLTIGLLVSFVMYTTHFYDPLREMARLWSGFQVALAGWERIGEILHLESNIKVIPLGEKETKQTAPKEKAVIEFKKVSFGYPDGNMVLQDVNFTFEKGKTYALVGPTGGGKTTTASLIARLYDPTEGEILLDGKDIRSYEHAERSKKIGFILQEPFLFSGSVRDNILYGHDEYANLSTKELEKVLHDTGLDTLLVRFEKGLETPITAGSTLSLGQKQLIAFIRAVLRKPEILILDEATANIDTITEKLLEETLEKLPQETVRVIIAHRLNTIENADEIFFVNRGEVKQAGSMEHALDMLLHGKRKS